MTLLTRFLCLLMLLLSGCSDNSTPTLRLGTNVWPGYEPLYLARQQGVLKEEKVHLIEFSSASQVIQAYRNDLIDAAALTLDEVLLLLGSGEKLKIVLVMDISNGADVIIGQPEISTLSDIKGKRVGVENNALGAYVLTRALEIAKLDPKAITIVRLDINEQQRAFLDKTIDAVVTFEPVRSKLLKSGGQLLFDSRQLPGEIVDVLIVRDEYLNSHPETIEYLISSWHQALASMKAQPKETAKILGLRMRLGTDETLAAYEGLSLPDQKENHRLLTQQPKPALLLAATNLEKVMRHKGILKQKVDPSSLFINSSLQHK